MGCEGLINRNNMKKWVAVLILTAICFLIPCEGFYTWQVKLFLAITVTGLSIMAFELLPIIVVAMLMPTLWGSLGVAPAEVVTSPWSGNTMFMLIGALFMAATLEDCGLLKRMAYFLLCKVKGSYTTLLISIFLVSVFLGLCTSGRGYLVMASLCAGLVSSLGGMGTKFGAGVAAAVLLGGCTSHSYTYQPTCWSVLMKQAAEYSDGVIVTPMMLLMHNWPIFLVSLAILFIVIKWYKSDIEINDVDYFQQKFTEMGKVTRREIVNLVMLVVVLTYVFTVGITKLDINWGFAIIPWLVYFFNGADRKTARLINWDMIFFTSACMGIGSVATYIGLGQVLGDFCMSILGNSTSIFTVFAFVFIVVFGLNFLMTPLAIFAFITGPMIMLGQSVGIDPLPILYSLNACSEAIILPYEYVPYMIVFGFGMMSIKDFMKINIVRSVIFFIGFLGVVIPYWKLIGLV